MNTILVTGGAGYIGSHTCIELLQKGYEVVVIDNFDNSSPKSIDRVRKITGKEVTLYEGDVRDGGLLDKIFTEHKIDWVIHFAGLKAVGESCAKPIEYYNNNLYGTLVLTDAMRKHGCKKIVFSSSATVYGNPEVLPLNEDCKIGGTTNPYGTSKYFQEIMLNDIYKSDNEWTVVLLRYFNPVGAHKSGLIGEDPKGIPNNLTPYIAKVAIGELKEVGVFGDDYDTPDGTGVRDYIHVVDLARGHVAALNWLGGKVGTAAEDIDRDALDWGSMVGASDEDGSRHGVGIFNLGTGTGSSVLDVIHSFERACGKTIPYAIKPRRAGDIATSFAACDKAERELGWVAQYDLDRMCEDSWRWQSSNPNGYSS